MNATENAPSGVDSVDFLVNNAGIFNMGSIETVTKSDVDAIVDVNLKSVINVTKCVLPGMKSRGAGCAIVNMSSWVSTLVGGDMCVMYSSTKTALDHLTRHMAVEFAKYKIRVNAINPGLVQGTDVFEKMDPELKKHIDEHVTRAKEVSPTGEIATLSDCVDLVLFLLSSKSKSINGECTVLAGGLQHIQN